MATLGVVIVGGPLTMSFLVLENTADFSVTAGVLAASIAASLIARSTFGYSFSTWRLHLRGENIRSANDIGWIDDLTVGKLMQPDPPKIDADCQSRANLCALYSLGSAREIRRPTDSDRAVRRIWSISPKPMFTPNTAAERSQDLARLVDVSLTPEMNAKTAMALFDQSAIRPTRGGRPFDGGAPRHADRSLCRAPLCGKSRRRRTRRAGHLVTHPARG